MKFYWPAIIRLIITIIILLSTDFWKTNYLYLFILIFILDQIDGFIIMLTQSTNLEDHLNKTLHDYNYNRYDKLIDLLTYILVIILGEYTNETRIILSILTFWRSIGVYKLYYNNDNELMHKYPDTTNSTILVAYLANQFPIVKNNYYLSIILGMLFKYKYELIHHSLKYN